MVEQYGTSILSILDSPSAATKLAKCRGIGSVNASTIKKDWDESRGRTAALSMHDVMTSICSWILRSGSSCQGVTPLNVRDVYF